MRRYRRTVALRRVAASASLLLAMIAVACSSDDESASTVASSAPAATTVAIATSTAAASTDAPTTEAPEGSTFPVAGTGALAAAVGDALQAAIDDWVAAGHLTGVTAAVITPDGTWTGAAGVDAAGTTLTADAAMSIMSISKTFTSAEVLLLASRGLIDLDAPLTDYVELSFDTGGATVRQALAMRTGFPSTSAASDEAAMAVDLDRIWTTEETISGVLADGERLGELGGTPRYNSLNYRILAAVVEQVTGGSFAEAVRADLIDSAGLDRMWVQPDETPVAPLTVGAAAPWADIVDPDGPFMPSASFASGTVGAGSLAGDAIDVARWGYQLYGGYVLDPALIDEMVADPQEDPNVGPYALGVMVYTDADGGVFLGHAGGGTDWPYTGAMHVWIGDAPISIALLTPQPADFGTDIFEVFMQLHDIAAA